MPKEDNERAGAAAEIAHLIRTHLDVGALLNAPSCRKHCVEELQKLGVSAGIANLGFTAFKEIIEYSRDFGADAAGIYIREWAIRLADRLPGFRTMFRGLCSALKRVSEDVQFRETMLTHVREEMQEFGLAPFSIEASRATSTEILQAQHVNVQFRRLMREIQKLHDEVEAGFAAHGEPELVWPMLEQTESVADSLKYAVEWDDYLDRVEEEDVLFRFAGDPDAKEGSFRWMVVAGAGGMGKSRLALMMAQCLQSCEWRAGRLLERQTKRIDTANWLPRVPTFMVIDYAPQFQGKLGELLEGLAQHAGSFTRPLRVLLLARETDPQWLDTIADHSTSTGRFVRQNLYSEAACPDGILRLTPLSHDNLVALMRARFAKRNRTPPSSGELIRAASELDNAAVRGLAIVAEAANPRPLFAAIAAEALIAAMGEATELPTELWDGIVRGLQTEVILGDLIVRDRNSFWRSKGAPDEFIEKTRLRKHENLLVTATMCQGKTGWANLRDKAGEPLASRLFPGDDGFDHERFSRMTGMPTAATLVALEPDILGEYYVLRRLFPSADEQRADGSDPTQSQALIDLAWATNPRDVAAFVRRTYSDFPQRAAAADYLLPMDGVEAEWTIRLLRSLIADLCATSITTHRSPVENERLSASVLAGEAEERRTLAVEAMALAKRMRAIVEASHLAGEVRSAILTDVALAWELTSNLVANVALPELITGDLRFLPVPAGSAEIERKRTTVAGFKKAALGVSERSSLIIAAPMVTDSSSNLCQAFAGLEQAPDGPIAAAEMVAMMDWIGAEVANHSHTEANRAWRTSCRWIAYVCHQEGDLKSCVRIGEEVHARIRDKARTDDAIVRSADLTVLQATCWIDCEHARLARDKADALTEKAARARLIRTHDAIVAVDPIILDLAGQRAVSTIAGNLCIEFSMDEARIFGLCDHVARCLAAHPRNVVLIEGLAKSLNISLFAMHRRLGNNWDDKLPAKDNLLARLMVWRDLLRACPDNSPTTAQAEDRLRMTMSARVADAAVAVLAGLVGEMVAVSLASLVGETDVADKLLGETLAACKAQSKTWSREQFNELSSMSGPLLLLPGGCSPAAREEWFRWLLDPARLAWTVEGLVSAMSNILPATRLGDDNMLGPLFEGLDAGLHDVDSKSVFWLLSPSLHGTIADGMVMIAAYAYIQDDTAMFMRWTGLLDQPLLREQSVFALHRSFLAAMRPDMREDGRVGDDGAGDVHTTSGEDEIRGKAAALAAAHFAADRQGDRDEARALLDRLIGMGQEIYESAVR